MSAGKRQVRVLVVDDDEKAWLAIRELLRGIGEFECIPEWVADFSAGVRHFDGRAIDVCLLDYHLAAHDGLAELKQAIRNGSRFAILYLSDEEGVDAVVTAMKAGAANYLVRKGLSSETLARAIAAALPPERRSDAERPPDFLGDGDQLFEYRIERVLGHGGFGITYLARDTHLDTMVAIKEYLPSELAYRASHTHVAVRSPSDEDAFQWGLRHFLKEAQTLARFSHPNLVRVRRFFEANATAYFVMEYAHGETLSAVLKRERTFSEDRLRAVLDPLLDALEGVHAAGVLHRDIKPDNIILAADGAPVLIDFGAARVKLGHKTQSLLAMFSAGYTPVEQYSSDGGEQGPWTDIYALGGLAYRCIAGHRPEDAVDRVRQDTMAPARELGEGRYAPGFLDAVDWALGVHTSDRPRSIGEWRKAFAGGARAPAKAPAKAPVEVPTPSAITKTPPRPPAARRSLALTGAIVATLAAGVTLWNYHGLERPAQAALMPAQAQPTQSAPVEPAAAPAVVAAKSEPPPKKSLRSEARRKPVAEMESLSAFRDCESCPEMQVIPAGAFMMGASGAAAKPSESPAHPVVLNKPFAIGRNEVTAGQWAECVRDGACQDRNKGVPGRLPAVQVTWHDAQAYAAWLSRKTGRFYRLPSEAAWEYAARSRVTTDTFWGGSNGSQCRYANGADQTLKQDETKVAIAECIDGFWRLAPVGSLRPNYFDLYDMLGNVQEWTQDCWRDDYSGTPVDGSAVADAACGQRVARGGGWRSPPDAVRANSRVAYDAGYKSDSLGFRVAAN